MSPDPVIELRGVDFAYEAQPILEGVDLAVRPLDLACIVGPNGGGKTTLLKLLLGLLQPTAGTVRVFGEAPARTRHRIGYTPQHLNFDPLFPITALDIVRMGRLGKGEGRAADRRAALAALDEMGMAGLGDRLFSGLSGGQRQRVLIARALACQPDLLLLDEPTANVDALVEQRLHETFRELNRRMTILMVSHDLGFVSDIVESVICVNRQVVVHPTSDITGAVIQDLYGGEVRMVRHDHRCSEEGHRHGGFS